MINYYAPKSGRILREDSTTMNQADYAVNAMGGNGFEFISDTVAHTPPTGQVFVALQVIADAVISAYTYTGVSGNTFTGNTIPSGTVVFGRFTSVTLTSGKVIAYKGV